MNPREMGVTMSQSEPIAIGTMSAGREMDALIAEKVINLIICESPFKQPGYQGVILNGSPYYNADGHGHYRSVPFYSTDIAAAWEVVEELNKTRLTYVEFIDAKIPGTAWRVVLFDQGEGKTIVSLADTAPLAICRAALKATESVKQNV
jgi:hypothetical protein